VHLSAENMRYVKTDSVKYIYDSDDFTVAGTVAFDESKVVRIYSIVSGSADVVKVSLGDYVSKNEILATLTSTDMSGYQSDYNMAKASLTLADKNLTRMKQMYESRAASDKDLAEAQTALTVAQFDYNKKKQILELYGGAENQDAKQNILSPIEGYIVEKNLSQGMQVRTDNSSNLFTISDLKSVWVLANVYESDIAKVHIGDKVSLTTIAYPETRFEGTVSNISNVLDPNSRVATVRTQLDNSKGLLKPQMFASVTISPKRNNQVLVIPVASMFIESGSFWVMKEEDGDKEGNRVFTKVLIKRGKTIGNFVHILDGLKAGDRIVTDGALFVANAGQ
jgi:cobalt-zinc-cadmium efflux system membrane fusion protein